MSDDLIATVSCHDDYMSIRRWLPKEHPTAPLSWRHGSHGQCIIIVRGLFDDSTDEVIDAAFAVMAVASWHQFILLVEPGRAEAYLDEAQREGGRWDRLLSDGEFPWPSASPVEIHAADVLISEHCSLPHVSIMEV